jgi:hypothetical protein
MDGQLVTIRNCSSVQEAQFVKSVLAADGIDAEIPDEQMLGVHPVPIAIGGARVTVRAEDAERANATLEAVLDQPIDPAAP